LYSTSFRFFVRRKSGQKNWFFHEKKKPYVSRLTQAKWQEKPQFSSTQFLQNKYPPFEGVRGRNTKISKTR
jgi:hypothetical protein